MFNSGDNMAEEIIETEEHFHLGSEEWTSHKNEYWGKTGEKIMARAVKTLYKKKDSWIVHCNKFGKLSDYKYNEGMDITIEKEVAIEVKNWNYKKGFRSYGIESVKRDILARRTNKNLPVLLVMTYSKLLTPKAKELLAQEGWAVLYLEQRIVNLNDWKEVYLYARKLKIAIAEAKAIHKQKLSSTKTQTILSIQ
jgi:hypothetical protein